MIFLLGQLERGLGELNLLILKAGEKRNEGRGKEALKGEEGKEMGWDLPSRELATQILPVRQEYCFLEDGRRNGEG